MSSSIGGMDTDLRTALIVEADTISRLQSGARFEVQIQTHDPLHRAARRWHLRDLCAQFVGNLSAARDGTSGLRNSAGQQIHALACGWRSPYGNPGNPGRRTGLLFPGRGMATYRHRDSRWTGRVQMGDLCCFRSQAFGSTWGLWRRCTVLRLAERSCIGGFAVRIRVRGNGPESNRGRPVTGSNRDWRTVLDRDNGTALA